MAHNIKSLSIDEPKESNPNFDKQYFDREMDRMDFLDSQERGNDGDFMARLDEIDKVKMYADDPSSQVKHIKDGS